MRERRPLSKFSAGAIVLALGTPPLAWSQSYTIQQVDLSTGGAQGYGLNFDVFVSGNGQFVAFASYASNLVPGDTNGKYDVFVRDLVAGTTERVSLGASGQQVSGDSSPRGLSYDGRYALYASVAADVHPEDPEALVDIFLRDRFLGTTELISLPFDASPSVYDCDGADISADGRYVVFDSLDSNLVPGDSNGASDVFLLDRLLGTIQIVSVATDGTQGDQHSYDAAVSADGTRIAFRSKAKNFYPNTDDYWHVFLRDRNTGTTHAVDVNPQGQLGNQHVFENVAISPDGSTVVFNSQATDLLPGGWMIIGPKPHLWREEVPIETVVLADGRPGFVTNHSSMSWSGRFVAFESSNKFWVAGDPTSSDDIFLQDTELHITHHVSSNGYANSQNVQSSRCSMSWDGRVIAFRSYADNLVPGSTPGVNHAYVRVSDPLTSGMVYCWPGTSPFGCQPQFALSGASSATAGGGHDLRVEHAPSGEIGLLLYSTGGPKPHLLSMGWMCLTPPMRRMPAHATGGSPPPAIDCTGSVAEDFNAWIASGQDPALVSGTPVWIQGWVRDPSAAGGAMFSDAVAFIVGP